MLKKYSQQGEWDSIGEGSTYTPGRIQKEGWGSSFSLENYILG